MLSSDELFAQVAKVIGTDRGNVFSGVRLTADLGFDSFTLLELHAALADHSGVILSEREWTAFETVDELHQVYRDAWDRQAAAGGPPRTHPSPGPAAAALRPDQVTPPQRHGRLFGLEPVTPQAVSFLHQLAISPDVGFRWRYRGAVPDLERFERDLWSGVLAQFVVVSNESGQPVGTVICYEPDLGLGTAYIGAAMLGQYLGSGIAIEPVLLFMRYVFDVWPLRKLYLEVPEFNFRQFASAQNELFQVEGRLRNHDYYQGRHWDRFIIAAYPDHRRTAAVIPAP